MQLLCEAYYNPRIIALIDLLAGSSSALRLVAMPPALHGATFSDLCEHMLVASEPSSIRGVALGLYRTCKDSHGHTVHYVLTNPEVESPLHATDRVFVLSPGEPPLGAGAALGDSCKPRMPQHGSARSLAHRLSERWSEVVRTSEMRYSDHSSIEWAGER